MKQVTKKSSLFFIFLLLICSLNLVQLCNAQIEENEDIPVTIKLTIRVFNIDHETKLANISIISEIRDYPENKSIIKLWVHGGGELTVNCTQYSQKSDGWDYKGESAITTWKLNGYGELFPFDSYSMTFMLYSVGILEGENCTFIEGTHQAYFDGSYFSRLEDEWKVENRLIPLVDNNGQELVYSLERNIDAILVSFLIVLVPIFACYYLLGSALILNPRKNLAERLRIFLSIFFFVPSFFMAIQTFFPYRASLSFPELLLINLLISTAILGFFSILGNQHRPSLDMLIDYDSNRSKSFQRGLDIVGTAIAVIVLVFIYWFTILGKVNFIVIIFLNYFIIPSYFIWIPLVNTKNYKISKKSLLSVIIGICLSIVLFSTSHYLNLNLGFVLTFGGFFTGIIVAYYIRDYVKGAIFSLFSGVLGTIIAGLIIGFLSNGWDGFFNSLQVFGVIGNLYGVYSAVGGMFIGYLSEFQKKRKLKKKK